MFRSNRHTFVSILLASSFPAILLAQGAGRIEALDPEGIQRLVAETGGAARVSTDKATGAARFVRIAPDSKRSLAPLSAAAGPEQKAAAFFRRHGRIFGISDPEAELKLGKTDIDPQGGAHLTYRQLYRGVPVFAGELKSHFDSAGRLTAVNGTFVPQIAVDPVPSATELAAGKAAIARVESGLESSVALSVRATTLYVYRTGLARGVSGRNHLVWEVEVVGDGGSIREFVYIDAHTGKFVDQITGIHDAMYRRAYDGKNLPTV
ncbi:MAG TPA: PepSY domain-containing protein, partial [Thermoanaerobaculia bacterium]